MQKRLASLGSAIMVPVLIVGAGALAYARWTRPAADGDAALAAGRFDRALSDYAVARARLDRFAPLRQAFASEYDRIAENELLALYRLGRYDDVIARAERAPEGAQPHFWAGCAAFAKANAEEKPDARLGWLNRAEDELRRAVEAAPEDWDAKYDFELAARLAAELRKQPKNPPKQMMQLLRPDARPGAKPARRVG
jgi:tetratricopeptide (TPR) repeat protein